MTESNFYLHNTVFKEQLKTEHFSRQHWTELHETSGGLLESHKCNDNVIINIFLSFINQLIYDLMMRSKITQELTLQS